MRRERTGRRSDAGGRLLPVARHLLDEERVVHGLEVGRHQDDAADGLRDEAQRGAIGCSVTGRGVACGTALRVAI